jgi:hypothetical protein
MAAARQCGRSSRRRFRPKMTAELGNVAANVAKTERLVRVPLIGAASVTLPGIFAWGRISFCNGECSSVINGSSAKSLRDLAREGKQLSAARFSLALWTSASASPIAR